MEEDMAKARKRNKSNVKGKPTAGSRSKARLKKGLPWWVIAGGLVLVVGVILGVVLMGKTASSSGEISIQQAYAKYQAGAFFLDVRTQEEWNDYHAPNSTLIPLEQLANHLDELPRDQEIVVVCRSGNRSQQGRDILLQAGFQQVTSVSGGLSAWRAAGYPVEP
jgi:phage shock protein E